MSLLTAKTFLTKPTEWQHIIVWNGDEWIEGYYRYSGHQYYPHELHLELLNDWIPIESFADEDEWMPVRD